MSGGRIQDPEYIPRHTKIWQGIAFDMVTGLGFQLPGTGLAGPLYKCREKMNQKSKCKK